MKSRLDTAKEKISKCEDTTIKLSLQAGGKKQKKDRKRRTNINTKINTIQCYLSPRSENHKKD